MSPTSARSGPDPDSPPPRGLSAAARRWWGQIHAGWAIDDSGRMLLEVALRAMDRRDAALTLIAKEGLVIEDGKGRTRAHPALSVAKDAELVILRGWRQLGLDVAPPGPIGRPPGRRAS